MPRIRTVKPAFFRHEELQDLEAKHLGKFPMLVFEGLWTQCDKAGRFEWRPRQLKLDILPFLKFDMENTLSILEKAGFLFRYQSGGKIYGCIPSFSDHQRISGKELQEKATFPDPPEKPQSLQQGPTGKQSGSNGEAPEKQQGPTETAGKEGNGVQEGKGNGQGIFLLPDWIPKEPWEEFVRMRKKKHPLTDYAKVLTVKELERLKESGNDPGDVLKQSIQRGWRGVFELKSSTGKESEIPWYEQTSKPS